LGPVIPARPAKQARSANWVTVNPGKQNNSSSTFSTILLSPTHSLHITLVKSPKSTAGSLRLIGTVTPNNDERSPSWRITWSRLVLESAHDEFLSSLTRSPALSPPGLFSITDRQIDNLRNSRFFDPRQPDFRIARSGSHTAHDAPNNLHPLDTSVRHRSHPPHPSSTCGPTH